MFPLLFSFLLATVFLSPETPVSPPAITNAPYDQRIAGIASDGLDFLAIWLDSRSGLPPDYRVTSPSPVYVAKLDANGRSLNPFGTKIIDAAYTAALVRTDAGYVVLWSGEASEVDWMPLDDDGVPTAPPAKMADGYLAAASSNGKTIFLLHGEYSDPGFASIYDLHGTLLTGTNLNLTNGSWRIAKPLVMPDGDYALIVEMWNCPGAVACTVTATLLNVSESGSVTTKPLQALSQDSQSAAAIGNGRLMLAWMSDDTTGTKTVSFRLFDLAGNPLTDETTVVLTNDTESISGAFPTSVGWDGENFLVAWQWPSAADEQSGDVRAIRVTPEGIAIDGAPTILSPTLGTAPLFATNGATTLVEWDTPFDGTANIDVRAVTTFDRLNDTATQTLPQAAALQTEAQLAGDLAVWREGDSAPAILAARFGEPPVTVSRANGLDQEAPAVAESRDQYLVVWRDPSRILAKRLDSSGHVIDASPIVISQVQSLNSGFLPAADTIGAASDGSDFLVIWPDLYDNLFGARISASGAVLDPSPITISQSPNGTAGSPRIIWNGSQYIVAWTADPSCKICLSPPGPPVSQIFIARMTTDGKIASSQKVWNGGYGSRIGLARGTNGLMLSWPVAGGDGAACIHAMALANDGTPVSSAQTLACTDNSLGWPPQFPDFDLAWDGSSFVAAWTLIANGSATVKAMRVSNAGAPLDADPFDVAPEGSASFGAALATSNAGATIVYDRIAYEPQYGGVSRLFTRVLLRSVPGRRRALR